MSNEQPKRQRCVIHKDIIQDIASAIRQKENSDNKYTPVQMKNAILNLPTGSITAQDEGKVVQNGSLVNQTSLSIIQNNTYDTTTKNQVVVNVPNTYVAGDEGKVVSNGALVAQGTDTVTVNGTIDTTLISSLVVNVSGGGATPFALAKVSFTAGQTVTATDGITTLTGDNSGEYVFAIPNAGTWTFAAGDKSKTASITKNATAIDIYLTLRIVPWSIGTDEEIAAMVAAMDAGTLSIQDSGWQIGDERTVSLAAMVATGVGENHAAQSVTLVLMDSQHYDLVGGGKDHFVVGLKHSLNEAGYMNSSSTTAGSWNSCARRAWCNNVFRAAIPETLRACFKQFNVITANAFDSSTNQTTEDYFALFAEKEIFGSRTYSNTTEAGALTQIEYYKTASHCIKYCSGGDNNFWWERSPHNSSSFCCVSSKGNKQYFDSGASVASGLAPFGCI